MIRIELLERKCGDIDSRIIPLDNLSGDDLDFILKMGGDMTEEIFTGDSRVNRVRKCDQTLIDINTLRFIVIKNIMLLWTVLQGNIKQRPHLDQLVAWLKETEHTYKGEMWLREVEIHEKEEKQGPECLFGESLEEALQETPGRCIEVPYERPEQSTVEQVDIDELFDTAADILGEEVEQLEHEKEVDRVIHEFFTPLMNGGEQELLLTEEV
jgi:hypothetical protein